METKRLYIDTCIANDAFVLVSTMCRVSPLRRADLKAPLRNWILDYIALYYMLDLDDQWNLTFGTSPVMSREIARMRERCNALVKKKEWLLDFYNMLEEKPKVVAPRLFPRDLISKLERLVPEHRGKDEDVEHLAYAILGRWDAFITTDKKTILAHREKFRKVGVEVASPLQFLKDAFMPLDQLVRTLHGSWTTLADVIDGWLREISASISPDTEASVEVSRKRTTIRK